MSASRIALLALATMGLGVMPTGGGTQTPRPTPNVVRQVDHILIASSKARELFALLSETFELPVVWPLSNYGRFASGGVAVGNVNLEVLRSSGSARGTTSSKFVGFALEPEPLRTSLPELDARQIPHGAPAPFRSRQPSGAIKTLWTTVALPSVSSEALEVFLCEYGHDVPARRHQLHEQLRSREGGPLSVLSVREIVCGARDLKRAEERWQQLLNPLQPSANGGWQIGAGSAIRVVPSDRDELQELVVNVKSLEQARQFLKERGLLGADQPAALTLASPHLEGLTITLVEPRNQDAQTHTAR